MHRTEAEGSVSGLSVDESLPLVPGTVIAASDRNAVQEEICNVIERAGLTVLTDATDTQNQLETVIFDEDLERTGSLTVLDSSVVAKNDSTGEQTFITFEGLASDNIAAGAANRVTEVKPAGVQGKLGNFQGPAAYIPLSISCSGASWSEDADSATFYTNTDQTEAFLTFATIAHIAQASISFETGGDQYSMPAAVQAGTSTGSTIIRGLRVVNYGLAVGFMPAAFTLHLWVVGA